MSHVLPPRSGATITVAFAVWSADSTQVQVRCLVCDCVYPNDIISFIMRCALSCSRSCCDGTSARGTLWYRWQRVRCASRSTAPIQAAAVLATQPLLKDRNALLGSGKLGLQRLQAPLAARRQGRTSPCPRHGLLWVRPQLCAIVRCPSHGRSHGA